MSIIYVDEIVPFSDGATRVNILVGEDGVDTPAVEDGAITLAKLAPDVLAELGGIGYVSNITALRNIALPVTLPLVNVLGYYTENDGGGGLFYFDSSSSESEDYGTILVPTGAPATGRWKRMFFGRAILAEWFGVKGDEDGLGGGSSNVTALGYVKNYLLANGGVLEFSPGKHYKVHNFYISNGGAFALPIVIKGNGATLWLDTQSSDTPGAGTEQFAVGYRGDGKFYVYDLTINHINAPDPVSDTAIGVYGVPISIGAIGGNAPTDVLLQNVRVVGSWDIGIHVKAEATIGSIRVQNCGIANTLSYGLQVSTCQTAELKGNYITGCNASAILTEGAQATVSNNRIYDCIQGLYITVPLSDVLKLICADNYIERTYDSGLRIDGRGANHFAATITGNVVRVSGQKYGGGERNATIGTEGHGIHLAEVASDFYGSLLASNRVVLSALIGIYLYNGRLINCVGNSVPDAGTDGIKIQLTDFTFHASNYYVGTTGYGIHVKDSDDCFLNSNFAGYTTGAALYLDAATKVMGVGNILWGATPYGETGLSGTPSIQLEGTIYYNTVDSASNVRTGDQFDLINPGGFISCLPWGKTALVQGVTDAPLPVSGSATLTKWVAPRAGSLLKFYAKLDDAITAETAVLQAQKNGSDWTGVTVTLDSSNQSASVSFDKDAETFAEGDELTILITTGAGFLPTGSAAILATLVVEM